jgi:hypothetical protein
MTQPIYSHEAMDAAFEAIRNPFDWKAPITAQVNLQDLGVTIAAIEYFTATPAYFVSQAGDTVTIRAAGYRAGPAGDH